MRNRKSVVRKWTRRALVAVAALTVGTAATLAVAAGTPAIIKLAQPAKPEMEPVLFKHWRHQRAYKCFACHPGVFSQWNRTVFDHDAMDAGKYCGACHNGKVAKRPNDFECEVCHVE